MKLALLPLLLVTTGCGYLDAPGSPRVEAHRGGRGLWPENSRTAVAGTIARGFPGLEFDLVLTRDAVPVLSHDAWLDPHLCTRTGESAPLGEGARVAIEALSLAQLQADYRCGGLRNPDYPEAQVVAEPVLSLDELLALVRAAPDLSLHLDIKAPEHGQHGAAAYADAVLSRLEAAGLPNPWYVSSSDPEMIRAFESRGEVRTQLSWPRYPEEGSGAGTSIRTELLGTLGLVDLVAAVREAGADGASTPYRLVERHVLEAARAEGLEVSVYTPDDPAALEAMCRLPVAQVISDYPDRAPCL